MEQISDSRHFNWMNNEQKEYLWTVILFGFFSLVFVLMIWRDGFSTRTVLMLAGSLLLLSAGLFLLLKKTKDAAVLVRSLQELPVEIAHREILYPQGYFFRPSSISADKKIDAARIDEITPNTFPPSYVVDRREVLFVDQTQREDLMAFGQRNQIPVVERTDIWELLNRPFLDTELDPEESERTVQVLAENGISPAETKAIRKKIVRMIMWVSLYSWTWTYLGHFDCLSWGSRLSAKRYWWTMDIALRNFGKG